MVGATSGEIGAIYATRPHWGGSRRCGAVEHDELWRRLTDADVLCAPSLRGESFGMVLTEAFAAGTPVVASEIAGYSEVVDDGVDGVLVPPGDPQRLAEELQRMYCEPGRRSRDGRRCRESARALRLAAVAERVERVYERAIEPRRRRAG